MIKVKIPASNQYQQFGITSKKSFMKIGLFIGFRLD